MHLPVPCAPLSLWSGYEDHGWARTGVLFVVAPIQALLVAESMSQEACCSLATSSAVPSQQ